LGNWWKFKHSKRTSWSAGTQTATVDFGGDTPANTGATEEYNGSAWTTSPATMATLRRQLAGAGTQTAALAIGGEECCSYSYWIYRCN
jgi:hypothetical protein